MVYNRIATLRAETGLSRQELADAVDVNYQTIGFIERGNYAPSLELTFAIADAFKVRITDVFSDEPFKPLFSSEEGA